MNFDIELATLSDLKEIVEVRKSSILKDATSAMSQDAAVVWANKPKAVEIQKQIIKNEIWLARSDSKKVMGWVRSDNENIQALYVADKYLRMGVGKKLLGFIEDKIFYNGFKVIYLEAALNAKAFYLRCGYTESPYQKSSNAINMEKAR